MKQKKVITVYRDDILSAIAKIHEYTIEGKDTFMHNELIQDAALRQLSIIGEAATKLPQELRMQYDDIPWKQVVGLRNVIIHEYSEVSIIRIWDTITEDLPKLKKSLECI